MGTRHLGGLRSRRFRGAPTPLEHIQLRSQKLQLHRLLPDQQLQLADVWIRSRRSTRCHARPGSIQAIGFLRPETFPPLQQARRDSQLAAELGDRHFAAP